MRPTSQSYSSHSSPRSPSAKAPGWACRSATASSTPTGERSATVGTNGAAPHSSSNCPQARTRFRLLMTDRLYYDDPYSRAFDASVLRLDTSAGRHLVRLDRTAFYPTSGGQPFDTGTLGSYTVADVYEDDDGEIVHAVEESS